MTRIEGRREITEYRVSVRALVKPMTAVIAGQKLKILQSVTMNSGTRCIVLALGGTMQPGGEIYIGTDVDFEILPDELLPQ